MANLTHWREKRITGRGVVILLLGLVISIAVGIPGCRKSPSNSGDSAKDSATGADKSVLHLEPFVVNLTDAEDNRFLRVGIDLALEREPSNKEGSESAARVRDCIIFVLSTWRSDSLLAPDGKQKLKDEILHALQDRVPELGVKEVYFTEFLVQR
jgi:flagellar basal body-associated protein FliL